MRQPKRKEVLSLWDLPCPGSVKQPCLAATAAGRARKGWEHLHLLPLNQQSKMLTAAGITQQQVTVQLLLLQRRPDRGPNTLKVTDFAVRQREFYYPFDCKTTAVEKPSFSCFTTHLLEHGHQACSKVMAVLNKTDSGTI